MSERGGSIGQSHYRRAVGDDVPLLARMNRELIEDERHRNRMSSGELEQRMRHWLSSEDYEAVLFHCGEAVCGYALYRRETDHVYLRQFFVCRGHRRRGVGRMAIRWLRQHMWGATVRIRLDVLVHNEAAIAFWRTMGFRDYCLTLEQESAGNGSRL